MIKETESKPLLEAGLIYFDKESGEYGLRE